MSRASKALRNPELRKECEKEAAACLKKMGFPPMETAADAVSQLPKALACITRRLEKLGEFLTELDKKKDEEDPRSARGQVQGESLIGKSLRCAHEYKPILGFDVTLAQTFNGSKDASQGVRPLR